MCGIAGLLDVGLSSGRQCLAQVSAAISLMQHRGPDDSVVVELGACGAWGMCRLAIRDPSPSGRQPFWHGSVGVIFNGEIYNTRELRAQLTHRGHTFSTSCDTEVVLKAYVEYGVAAFGLLDGIFAIAVTDPATNRFLLARDEFGVKPLYVSHTRGRLVFGSEPKALGPMGALNDGVDTQQLVSYLRYQYVPEPHSPWLGVRRVPRGTVEVYDQALVELRYSERFVQTADPVTTKCASLREWAELTDEVTRLSVERQMVSDRPLGVFLSGGIDSTVIAAHAARVHPGLRAFGISVPGWERDERAYMERASAHLDVELTVATLAESDFDRLTSRILDTYDEPFGDFSALPTMLVSEEAGKELRVVLSGDGGDELFGGYARYEHASAAQRLGRLQPSALRIAERVMRIMRYGPAWMVQRVIDEARAGGHGYAALLAIRTHAEASSLLGESDPCPLALAPRRELITRNIFADSLSDAMAIDVNQYLAADINTKVDRATMSVSLEARVPLLGGPVARLADVMPTAVKINGGVGKWPLKEILRQRGFTEAFINRKKTGFSFPISGWLRRAVERRTEYEDMLRNPPAPLSRARSGALLDELLHGADNGHAVWSILVLSAWLSRYGR